MTLSQFLARYPEFQKAGTALVQSVLAEAATQLDQGVWGNLYDAGHGACAADILALSPFGQQARMVPKSGTTTYRRRFEELQKTVACGGAVAGLGGFPRGGVPCP